MKYRNNISRLAVVGVAVVLIGLGVYESGKYQRRLKLEKDKQILQITSEAQASEIAVTKLGLRLFDGILTDHERASFKERLQLASRNPWEDRVDKLSLISLDLVGLAMMRRAPNELVSSFANKAALASSFQDSVDAMEQAKTEEQLDQCLDDFNQRRQKLKDMLQSNMTPDRSQL